MVGVGGMTSMTTLLTWFAFLPVWALALLTMVPGLLFGFKYSVLTWGLVGVYVIAHYLFPTEVSHVSLVWVAAFAAGFIVVGSRSFK